MSASSNDPLALAKLKESIEDLDRRTRDGERKRAAFFLALAVLILAMSVLVYLYLQVIWARSSSRDYYNDQLRRLACTAVRYTPSSQSQTIHDLRDHYRCPPAQHMSPRPIRP